MSNILIYSNAPWAPSGYGTQTAVWAKRFQSLGHNVAIAAFHGLQGAPLNWENGIVVYPGSARRTRGRRTSCPATTATTRLTC